MRKHQMGTFAQARAGLSFERTFVRCSCSGALSPRRSGSVIRDSRVGIEGTNGTISEWSKSPLGTNVQATFDAAPVMRMRIGAAARTL
jgi:hypothetical protein